MTEPPPSLQYDRDARFKRKLEDHAYAKQSAVAFRRHALKDRRENIKLRAALDAQSKLLAEAHAEMARLNAKLATHAFAAYERSQLLAEAREALEQLVARCEYRPVNVHSGPMAPMLSMQGAAEREAMDRASAVLAKLKAASGEG